MIAAPSLYAQSGTSVGLGEAFTTLARGSEAIFWNPANLALRDKYPRLSVSVFSIKLNFGQNSFDRDFYDTYFTTKNKVLSDADVDKLLSKIPNDGLKADMRSDISLMAIAIGNLGISLQTYSYFDVTLPKAMIEIPFKGLEQKTYDFAPSGNAEAVSNVTVAYGRTVMRDKSLTLPLGKTLKFTQIAAGMSFSYNLGLGIVETETAHLYTTLSDNGVVGHGSVISRGVHLIRTPDPTLTDPDNYKIETADKFEIAGKGFGINLAASGKLDNGYIMSFVIKNLFDRITWDKNALEINRVLDTGTPKFFIGTNQLEDMDEDSIITDNDKELSSFKTSRPVDYRFAVGKKAGRFMYATEIGREDEQFVYMFGGGIRLLFLDLFGGYRYKTTHNLNFGFGIGWSRLYFDLGLGTRGGATPKSNKGIIIASSLRLGL
jgi:hypothetical protein